MLLATACQSTTPQNQSTAPINESATTEKAPPAEIVRVTSPEVTVPPGGQAPAAIDLTIAERFHINANPPSASYLIPTELSIAPANGISADGFSYPAPLNKKFSFAEQPIAVYEKNAQIKFVVHAARGSATGKQTLRARLRVQPCDEKACYAPRTVETDLSIIIR